MSTIKLNDLKKAAKAINELDLFDELINVKAPSDILKEELIIACQQLTDEDFEELDEAIVITCKALLEDASEEEETEEETTSPADVELTLNEVIETSEDIDELKGIIKSEAGFEKLKKGLNLQKDIEKLRTKMLEILNTPVEEKPAKKTTVGPTSKSTNGKISTEKKESKKPIQKVGVIATIVECIEKAGKKGISREDIHAVLVDKFPDKATGSMMNTVKVQVPTRINKEKFELEKLENGNFRKK